MSRRPEGHLSASVHYLIDPENSLWKISELNKLIFSGAQADFFSLIEAGLPL